MSDLRAVGIVGLGLIGGSLARDLAARGVTVLGDDHDADTLRAARASGAVHTPLGPELERLGDVDIVVSAVPVSAAPSVLRAVAARVGPTPIVTDVGSTKRSLCDLAAGLGLGRRFVGAHPLAGDHRAGWAASRAGLFSNAPVYLCPTAETDPAAVLAVRRMWERVGARPEVIEPGDHDRLLAWTSHLPQAVSTALARVLHDAGVPPDRLGRGGRDMTRLARSSADVWTPIALDNAEALAAALAELEGALRTLRDAVVRRDRDAVHRFFDTTGTGAG